LQAVNFCGITPHRRAGNHKSGSNSKSINQVENWLQ
jgi:hypothetical protein